jgi:hypothetical protein
MNNNYEVASIIELGKAQDVVMGIKVDSLTIDALILEFGTLFIVILDDDNE